MKKEKHFYGINRIRVNIVATLIIILGFGMISIINYFSYSQIIEEDIKNISKLTATNLYSQIDNELIKPIFVSLTMANDTFLKTWIKDESQNQKKEKIEKLQEYLLAIEQKYDYHSVFFISEKTNQYYHYSGILKNVSKEDPHDKWYYDFLESKETYELDVDNDQASENRLTVFINCRVEEKDGNQSSLLGVTGVGVELNQLQGMLRDFEEKYELEAFLMDQNGLIQVHSNTNWIEKQNVFEDIAIAKYREEIAENHCDFQTFRYSQEHGIDGFLITRYIKEFGWYLVIKKDTSILKEAFRGQLIKDFFILISIVFCVIILIARLIRKHREQIIEISKIDELTQLPNRRVFNDALMKTLRGVKGGERCEFNVFVLDIDNFKKINDTKGHVFGDKVIQRVGISGKEAIGVQGIITRWGGDEFAGIIYGSFEEGVKIIQRLMEGIQGDIFLKENQVTISCGVTKSTKEDTLITLINRADKWLYEAKSEGKNRYIAK